MSGRAFLCKCEFYSFQFSASVKAVAYNSYLLFCSTFVTNYWSLMNSDAAHLSYLSDGKVHLLMYMIIPAFWCDAKLYVATLAL